MRDVGPRGEAEAVVEEGPILWSIGLNHRTAPVGVRERAAASLGTLDGWYPGARAVVDEALVISTCHRLEVYVVAHDRTRAESMVADALGGIGPREIARDGWCIREGVDAAAHLARVAAGLDSQIVGEAEIAGQVRRAAQTARASGALGPVLEGVVAAALRASGRVRAETRLAHGVTSLASAAVTLATRHAGTLEGRHVLVVGSGQTARALLARLARVGARQVTVASRSPRHGAEAAAIVGGEVWGAAEVATRAGEADVILAATQAVEPLITCDRWQPARADRLRVIVDLSVPRVVEPAIAHFSGVELFSVDDLGDLVQQSLRRRERAIPAAEAIVAHEVTRLAPVGIGRRARAR